MRTQLSTLAKQLHKAVNLVRPQEQTSKQQRMAFFDRVVSKEQPSTVAHKCLAYKVHRPHYRV